MCLSLTVNVIFFFSKTLGFFPVIPERLFCTKEVSSNAFQLELTLPNLGCLNLKITQYNFDALPFKVRSAREFSF